MKPKLLWDEMRSYGYVFSWKKSLFVYVVVMAVALELGVLFGLSGLTLAALGLWVFMLLPFFMRNLYKNRFMQGQFMEANTYIEQYLYSFQKTGKILSTLQDVRKLFDGDEMARRLDLAIDYIQHTYERSDVEERALAMIAEAYPVEQIRIMHRFSLQVEENGGEYSEAVLLMLDSRRLWADRVYDLLKEKARRRVQILVSVGASLALCTMLLVVSKNLNVDIPRNAVTRWTTLLVLAADLFIFYKADAKLSAGYMKDQMDNENYLRQYEKVRRCEESGKKELGLSIAKRNVTRGLQMVFPQWLMKVSLLLQSENVQVAIAKSVEDAPPLLVPELEKLCEALLLHPTDIEPYLSFLQEYSLPEIQSAMKMLYSISEGTGGNASAQIGDIIRRNQLLMDKAEAMKNEDALAGMYALFLAPQLTGAVKLLADMLVIFYGVAAMGNVAIF